MSKEMESNLSLKIFALIIAVILWSYVMSEENPVKTKEIRNVKVQLTNTSSLDRENLVIMSPEEAKINIRVEGKVKTLNDITEDDFTVTADLSGYKEGSWKVPIYIETPSDVKLIDHSPKEILFKFEKIVREPVIITLETEKELPEGYVLGTPEIKPQSIYIEGPRSWVSSVSKVLATINLEGRTEDIRASVPVSILDSNDEVIRGLEQEQNFVDVFIPVYRTKTVPIELKTVGNLPDNQDIADIIIKPATVDIMGTKEALRTINSISTKTIDINSLVGKKNVLVELDIPENIELVNPAQEITINLNVDESATKTFNYSLHDVNIKNLGPDLSIEEENMEQVFEIKVIGTSSKVNALNKGDLFIEMDLSGLEEGTHKVDLTVREQTGITSMEIIPEALNIKLLKE